MPSPDDEWADGLGWSSFQERLFESAAQGFDEAFNDELLLQAFDVGWFDQDADTQYRQDARDYVIEWFADELGINFDEVFDWDDWRENYG